MKKNDNPIFDVVVLGGGAAGLVAAITSARNGAKTALIEHKDRVGKKILSTGNGKCNYTNALQDISYYHGDDPAFVLPVMEQFGFDETIAFFQELGISPKQRNGYYYPQSEQAASVTDVLRMELSYQNITCFLECNTSDITQKRSCFLLHTDKGTITARNLIFATGLLAAPKTGSDGSAIPLIKQFGHRLSDVVPALVALQCSEKYFKQLAGIRTMALVTLLVDGKAAASDCGEIQLTDYGISGIPVFQVSRFATKALKKNLRPEALIDFLPDLSEEELFSLFTERFLTNAHQKTVEEAMIGFLNKKLCEVLLKESEIPLHAKADSLSKKDLRKLTYKCKNFHVHITGSKSFEQAQVCAGGVLTKDIDPHTMESRLVPGIYFAGEITDIDGICGGYNLQWAWSSGYVAGLHAAKKGNS